MSVQRSHITLWSNDDGELCAEGHISLGFEEPEVEVTDDMINAGEEVLAQSDSVPYPGLTEVFRAMVKARDA